MNFQDRHNLRDRKWICGYQEQGIWRDGEQQLIGFEEMFRNYIEVMVAQPCGHTKNPESYTVNG